MFFVNGQKGNIFGFPGYILMIPVPATQLCSWELKSSHRQCIIGVTVFRKNFI